MLAVRERTCLSHAALLETTVLLIVLRYDILTSWLPEWLKSVPPPPTARAQLAVVLLALSVVWFMWRFLRTAEPYCAGYRSFQGLQRPLRPPRG